MSSSEKSVTSTISRRSAERLRERECLPDLTNRLGFVISDHGVGIDHRWRGDDGVGAGSWINAGCVRGHWYVWVTWWMDDGPAVGSVVASSSMKEIVVEIVASCSADKYAIVDDASQKRMVVSMAFA